MSVRGHQCRETLNPTVQLRVAVPCAKLGDGKLGARKVYLGLWGVEDLQEQVDEDAQGGGCQVADGLGQRHVDAAEAALGLRLGTKRPQSAEEKVSEHSMLSFTSGSDVRQGLSCTREGACRSGVEDWPGRHRNVNSNARRRHHRGRSALALQALN